MSGRHPSSDLLADFAAGQLPLAPSVTLSAHLETCAVCRGRVEAFEDAEGNLLESSPPVALAPGALSRILDRIDANPTAEPRHVPHPETLGDVRLPAAVARVGLARRRWLAPGIWTAAVRARRTDDWRTLLLRAPGGMKIPTHEHGGRELIAVLQGTLHDGHTYVAGDFAEHGAGSGHRLEIARDGPCACLISIQGRAHWHGWARVIAPLAGM